jgi:hypothetical protein
MQRDDFADDLVYRPSLPAILIGVALWSAIGFIGAIIFAGLS